MRSLFVHRDGNTRREEKVDPAWLAPDAPEAFWLNIDTPTAQDRELLLNVFHFHELAVEDAMASRHHPKVEGYDGFLYLILHGVGGQKSDTPKEEEEFETRDIDFFLGRNYLVTVHTTPSPSIEAEQVVCARHPDVLGEGPAALMHRIIDNLVDRYRPTVDAFEECLSELEEDVFKRPQRNPMRAILTLKAEVNVLRRVALPQRDAIGRLARREFPEISDKMAYRFRDVYDHLVRITDEAGFFQDRVTGLIDAYLSSQSNRMNQVMKVLTVISTIFMPLTVLTSMYGMNVTLPHLPGGADAQFWWIFGMMLAITGVMLWVFRRLDWL